VHETGLAPARRDSLPTCRAMITISALLADAEALWSEELPHRMLIDSRLRIINPFRDVAGPAGPAIMR
jgi:predicted nucleic acid-binding protein